MSDKKNFIVNIDGEGDRSEAEGSFVDLYSTSKQKQSGDSFSAPARPAERDSYAARPARPSSDARADAPARSAYSGQPRPQASGDGASRAQPLYRSEYTAQPGYGQGEQRSASQNPPARRSAGDEYAQDSRPLRANDTRGDYSAGQTRTAGPADSRSAYSGEEFRFAGTANKNPMRERDFSDTMISPSDRKPDVGQNRYGRFDEKAIVDSLGSARERDFSDTIISSAKNSDGGQNRYGRFDEKAIVDSLGNAKERDFSDAMASFGERTPDVSQNRYGRFDEKEGANSFDNGGTKNIEPFNDEYISRKPSANMSGNSSFAGEYSRGDNFDSSNQDDNEIYGPSAKEEKMSNKNGKKRLTKAERKKRRRRNLIITLSTLLAVMIALVCVVWYIINKPIAPSIDPVGGEPTQDKSQITTPVELQDKVVNILILGLDDGESLSDVMMLATFDLENKRTNILQIPRDTWVGTDYPTGKMNAVYGSPKSYTWCEKCGAEVNGSGVEVGKHVDCGTEVILRKESKIGSIINVINDRLGLPVDQYVILTVKGLRDMVDAVGGVDVDVPRRIPIVGGHLEPGYQHLDGYKAERLVRHRGDYRMGDLDRIKVQRTFLAGFAQKLKDMSLVSLVQTGTRLLGNRDIMTSFSIIKAQPLAKVGLEMNMDNVMIYQLPGEPFDDGLSYYSIHKEETLELINEYFNLYRDEDLTMDDITLEERANLYEFNQDNKTFDKYAGGTGAVEDDLE